MKRYLLPAVIALLLSSSVFAAETGKLLPTSDGDAAWLAQARAAYPLKICVVSDEALDSMGDSPERIYRVEGKPDRLVIFCCDGCEADFKSEPAGFLAKLDAAAKPDDTPHAKDTAVAAMNTWLSDVDHDHYDRSWDTASAAFKKAITRDAWIAALKQVRSPLGSRSSRQLLDAKFTTKLPSPAGTVEGEFVLAQFNTAFENAPKSIETVTFSKESDGTWKCAGYYIKAIP